MSLVLSVVGRENGIFFADFWGQGNNRKGEQENDGI